jgi:hypothetical protein
MRALRFAFKFVVGGLVAGIWFVAAGSENDAFAQVPPPMEEIEDVETEEPKGDCFRTANDSGSQHMSVPAGNIDCGGRICSFAAVPVPGFDDEGNPIVTIMQMPVCNTPPGELPYTYEVAAREVPNVSNIAAGNGWDDFERSPTSVACLLVKACSCTEEQAQLSDPCDIGGVMSEVGQVTGWVIKFDSNECDPVPPRDSQDEEDE